MKLFSRVLGEGEPIVVLHGLFGSSDNWLTQAKLLGNHYKVYSVDLRNHGQSPHSDEFDYVAMAKDLDEFVDANQLHDPVIIGHSMGGKAAMNFALAHPEKLSKLIVVDIAPKAYDLEHYTIAEGLKAIPVDNVTSRSEADEILAQHVPEPDVRQFLLKNLQRKSEGGFSWKINLPVITDKLANIGLDLQIPGRFEKPTLFVRGLKSKYIRDSDWNRIIEVFPNAELESMDTGHWVQAEKPQEFSELVTQWINK
jgi:pimeloyl-ACP methyl ester carboxylesterase